MFLSFRAKLFAISVLVLAAFMAVTGLYLHQALKGWTESRIEADLQVRAEMLSYLLEGSDGDELQARALDVVPVLVPRGALGEDRITVIDGDGRVVADSHFEPWELEKLDDHSRRPEIRAVAVGDVGVARRFSESVDTEMLYVAVSPRDSDAVVRVSTPLTEVEEALAHLRLLLFVAGGFGLGIAILMSSLASKLMSQTLRNVLDRARAREQPNASSDEAVAPESLLELTRTLDDTLELLANERDRFRTVLDEMGEGLVATDRQLGIVLWNRNTEELLGVTDEFEGRKLSEFVPDEVVQRLVDGTEKGIEFDVEEGSKRRIHARATPRRSGGFVFVFHDVTEIRQLQTIRRDFVANISHELRTPVAVIQANAETLLDGALDEREHAETFARDIQRNSNRIARLVDDLLELSRIESGEIELDPRSMKLAPVVERVAKDVEHIRCLRDVKLHIAIDDELPVVADEDRLEQILVNLLENAFKYGAQEGGSVTVEAEEADDGMVIVEVGDDGPGIAEEHGDRLFERFYRVDRGRSSDDGGTGLGLAIVKHLVTSMEGEVGYRPARRGGSVFWFRLPRR